MHTLMTGLVITTPVIIQQVRICSVLRVGLPLVWVRVSCCFRASWLRWVLPQRLCILMCRFRFLDQSLANKRFPFVFATCLFCFKCVECCDSVSTISE